jgi:2'-5' RNA ligase
MLLLFRVFSGQRKQFSLLPSTLRPLDGTDSTDSVEPHSLTTFSLQPYSLQPMNLWRTFIALEIGDDTRRRLAELQHALKRGPWRVSWAAPETIHLTLLFLGDILPETVPSLVSALDGVAADSAPFSFTVTGTGTFGPPRSPRVVWCGVREGRDGVVGLQAAVCEAVRAKGFFWSDTREFAPHLTLGRVKIFQLAKSSVNQRATSESGLMQALAAHAHDDFGATCADRLLLLRSQLQPTGAVHTVLHAAPFLRPAAAPA